ncbi:hypothetical protein [Massilia sp. S19_KUP03_FR1]|uniref:hypothetical protein n=1 Tax=Massilia sp. S19_KUP03_FR1 TaxID=3025503 RepID=UPI002FCD8104
MNDVDLVVPVMLLAGALGGKFSSRAIRSLSDRIGWGGSKPPASYRWCDRVSATRSAGGAPADSRECGLARRRSCI